MRSKEDAHDYRYFPDPDLVPLIVNSDWISGCKKKLPELADAKTARFVQEYSISEYDAAVLTADKSLGDYFEEALKHHKNAKKISNWITSELLRELNNDTKEIEACAISAKNLARMVALIDDNTISGKIAKTIFEEMYKTGQDPDKIIKEKGLSQITDNSAIEKIVDEVIVKFPEQHGQYKSGKDKLFGFFVGEVMKAMKGKANPQMVNDLLKKKL
jgi:aspartyl-tRNA(Asn)/glutamyl-tRNA(Gln) amidotransferase subunit B